MIEEFGESGNGGSLTLCNQSVEINAFGAVTLAVPEERHLMNESAWQVLEYVL
jgi:hypothetical protein